MIKITENKIKLLKSFDLEESEIQIFLLENKNG